MSKTTNKFAPEVRERAEREGTHALLQRFPPGCGATSKRTRELLGYQTP